jgi:hypothetical protein
MNGVDITVEKATDWSRFSDEKLDTIVDPMVFRSADVFLRGRKSAQETLPAEDSDKIWKALSANIGSLVAFFDALIMSEHLPIIDYGFTFDSNVGFDTFYLYDQINGAAEYNFLRSVHVMAPAYTEAKDAALSLLKRSGQVPHDLARSILDEMSTFDYSWQSDISALGQLSEDDQVLARFMLGGLLFSAYAQQTGAGHLLQPKRARLYLAASLGAASASHEYETDLFDELKKIAKQEAGIGDTTFEFDALPPFLPYLLRKDPETPDALLRSALALGKTGMVRDYRQWRTQLLRDWRDKGRIDTANEKEIKRITQAMVHELKVGDQSNIDLKLTMTGIDASLNVPIKRLLGWVLTQLPGRRYSKLLMRLMIADHEYRQIDRHLQAIWNAA